MHDQGRFGSGTTEASVVALRKGLARRRATPRRASCASRHRRPSPDRQVIGLLVQSPTPEPLLSLSQEVVRVGTDPRLRTCRPAWPPDGPSAGREQPAGEDVPEGREAGRGRHADHQLRCEFGNSPAPRCRVGARMRLPMSSPLPSSPLLCGSDHIDGRCRPRPLSPSYASIGVILALIPLSSSSSPAHPIPPSRASRHARSLRPPCPPHPPRPLPRSRPSRCARSLRPPCPPRPPRPALLAILVLALPANRVRLIILATASLF